MPKSLGVVANVYNEINSLPGWLEMAHSFFDHVSVYHAGPGGVDSTDGTIELLEKWKVPIHRGPIDAGFGVVRTAAIRSSPCDYVMLLDADERFFAHAPTLTCSGDSTPPDEVNRVIGEYTKSMRDPPSSCGTGDGQWPGWEDVGKLGSGLSVAIGESYNQGSWLRSIIEHGALDAVITIRRHWHDLSWRRPTQNWHQVPDYQTRLVRNDPSIYFEPGVKMHERLLGASNVYRPNQTHGPFFDHYHLFFKAMEKAQRAFDIRVYDALHFGTEIPKP